MPIPFFASRAYHACVGTISVNRSGRTSIYTVDGRWKGAVGEGKGKQVNARRVRLIAVLGLFVSLFAGSLGTSSATPIDPNAVLFPWVPNDAMLDPGSAPSSAG
jgi:hypothetical protein